MSPHAAKAAVALLGGMVLATCAPSAVQEAGTATTQAKPAHVEMGTGLHVQTAKLPPTPNLSLATIKRLTKKHNQKLWLQTLLWDQTVAANTEAAEAAACGGDLPTCCILHRESKGDPLVVEPAHAGTADDPGDPLHHASGKWQFMPGTWNNFAGYPYAAAAPPSVQNARAREVWAGGAGASNWAGDHCG